MNKRQRLDKATLTTKLDPYMQQEVLSYIPTLAQVMEPILLRRYHEDGRVLEGVQIHQNGPFEFHITGRIRYWGGVCQECVWGGDCESSLLRGGCGEIEDDINDRFVVGTRERLLSLPLLWPSMQRETLFPVASGFYDGLYCTMVVGGQRV